MEHMMNATAHSYENIIHRHWKKFMSMFEDDSVDLIITHPPAELKNDDNFCKECYRVLKSGGAIITPCKLVYSTTKKDGFLCNVVTGRMHHSRVIEKGTKSALHHSKDLINKYSNERDLVIDPFVKDDLTAQLTMKTNRRFIGGDFSGKVTK